MSPLARRLRQFLLILCLIALPTAAARGQERQQPGRPIGKVSALGRLILMELDKGALGQQNLFNLDQRSLRFTPERGGYRVENLPLEWDSDFGRELNSPEVRVRNFSFPFSGKTWNSFSVGVNGSIRFGPAARSFSGGPGRGFAPPDRGGVSVSRFAQLSEAAGSLVNTVPAICVFFKPRMSGKRYARELRDRVVVTWELTEPYGGIQDFTWTKTTNRFQALLYKDGVIVMSYQQLAAKDGVAGVYPLVSPARGKKLAVLPGSGNSGAAGYLELRNLKLSAIDGLLLKVTFQTASAILHEGNPGLSGIAYSVHFYVHKSPDETVGSANGGVTWTIFGFAPRNRMYGGTPRYFAFGPGVSHSVTASGDTISIQGILPPQLRGATEVTVSAGAFGSGSRQPVSQIAAHRIALRGIRSPEVHFSAVRPHDGPFAVVYEAFHYYALPNPRDLACTVIKGLGDHFDFLAYYSDFRVDNQEAGTPSDGPRGAVGGAVTGIGVTQHGLASYCSQGRFQWGFIQPVYVGSNQMQKWPPPDAVMGNADDITFYQKQLAEISQNGKMPPYMYAMSQIGHEMGHRWAASVSAKVGSEVIPLGPVHWAMGLQAPAAFPYVRPTEASIMGGGVWQDNFDGAYTQLDDNYYVPATGYSYLDLYLMGLISPDEAPDFFILRHLVFAGRDANGRPIFKADRTKVTIQDVIAAEGVRTPGVDRSQRHFNTGMVMVVQHGFQPSPLLIKRTNGIRKQWIRYFSIVTGRRASMTVNPK